MKERAAHCQVFELARWALKVKNMQGMTQTSWPTVFKKTKQNKPLRTVHVHIINCTLYVLFNSHSTVHEHILQLKKRSLGWSFHQFINHLLIFILKKYHLLILLHVISCLDKLSITWQQHILKLLVLLTWYTMLALHSGPWLKVHWNSFARIDFSLCLPFSADTT